MDVRRDCVSFARRINDQPLKLAPLVSCLRGKVPVSRRLDGAALEESYISGIRRKSGAPPETRCEYNPCTLSKNMAQASLSTGSRSHLLPVFEGLWRST